VLIFGLLYLNTKSSFKAGVVMLAVPFSAVGAIWLLYLLGYNVSIAVVGRDDCASWASTPRPVSSCALSRPVTRRGKARGNCATTGDLVEAIIHGAVKRVRPKAMTVSAAFIGLLPSCGSFFGPPAPGRLMKRIAAPMVGGLVKVIRDGAAGVSADLLPVAAQGKSWRAQATL